MALGQTQGYIYHPSDIPTKISLCTKRNLSHNTASDSGNIGISVRTPHFYAMGTPLEIEIAIQDPAFKASGKVSWCIPEKDGMFRTGIVFDDTDTAYSVRMIEQICHIEHYRKEVEQREGRRLSQEAAAIEWIKKFAHDFPSLEFMAHRETQGASL